MLKYKLRPFEIDAKALQNFQMAADQGDAGAQFFLGHIYQEGRGVQKDACKAFGWYEKAANQDHGYAQFRLGCLYYQGECISENKIEAARLFQMAAKQDVAPAQMLLGLMYFIGMGVPQSSSAGVDLIYQAEMNFLEIGERTEALKAYDRINEINPEHVLGKKLYDALYP